MSIRSSQRDTNALPVLWVGPFPADNNGIEEYARVIIENMPSRYRVSTSQLWFNNWSPDYPRQVFMTLANVVKAAFQRPRPIIHIQYCPLSTGPGAVLAGAVARALKLKVVATVHEDKSSVDRHRKRFYWRAYAFLEDRFFGMCNHLVVHADAQRGHLPTEARERAVLIEFGVTPLGRVENGSPAANVVGCFGLIAPYKGIETVIEACALAWSRIPDLRLIVAGGAADNPQVSSYVASLRELMRAKLGDRADLHLDVPQAAFDSLYQRAAIVCFGLRRVNQSTTFYRALGHRKPVVATNVGGVADIVKREGTGRVVPVDDPAAMAGEIEALLHPDAYRAAQKAIDSYANTHTWRANAEEHARLYDHLKSVTRSLVATP